MRALIVFLCLVQLHVSGQNTIDKIEKEFADNDITISQTINGKSIDNSSCALYKRITNRTAVHFDKPIDFYSVPFLDLVDYYNYSFPYPVRYNKIMFAKGADFTNTKHMEDASFHECYYYDDANFTWSLFKKNATFSRSNFKQHSSFVRAVFNGEANFFNCQFHGAADFYGCELKGPSIFMSSHFYDEALFSFAEINSDVNFKKTEFNGPLLFNNCEINSTLDFSSAKFDTLVDFSNSVIKGKLVFSSATQPFMFDFSNCSIENPIDLTDIKLNENHTSYRINLVNTDISKIKMYYENCVLWFPENTPYDVKCNIYESLLSSLQTNGFQKSYELLDIEFQKFKYTQNGRYIVDKIQELWWNYGYDKGRIFSWAIKILLFFTFINSFFLNTLMGNVYDMGFLKHESVKERTAIHHPLLTFFLNIPMGFLYTLILLIGGAFGMGFQSEKIKNPNFLGLIYIIFIGIVGLGCSAFILNFIFDL